MDNFDFKKYLAEGKLLNENEYDDEDIVIYDGEEHIIMSRDGNMIYIRPLEDSAILGKRDVIKVPARALAYKSDLDKMYDEYKPKDELDEDMNDPVLMKARAAKMADEKEMARQAALDKKYGSNFMDKLDAEIGLKNELQDLKDERAQLMIDMEQEAEPEGGEIADDYGSRLNDIDSRRELIQKDIDDLRMYESVNEVDEKWDKIARDEYDKPWMELSIAQKQEMLSYANRETEKEFETDFERRRKETSDYVDEGIGASLGPGPKASADGVKDNSYVKEFGYKLVPKKIKGSGLIVKQLFEAAESTDDFQGGRLKAFDRIEQEINDIYKMLSNAKNETAEYYKENPGSYSVVKPTDLVLDYIKDIKDLLKGE